jgi:hypothetical protein
MNYRRWSKGRWAMYLRRVVSTRQLSTVAQTAPTTKCDWPFIEYFADDYQENYRKKL